MNENVKPNNAEIRELIKIDINELLQLVTEGISYRELAKEISRKLDCHMKEVYKMEIVEGKHITFIRNCILADVPEYNPYSKRGYYIAEHAMQWGSRVGYDSLNYINMKKIIAMANEGKIGNESK